MVFFYLILTLKLRILDFIFKGCIIDLGLINKDVQLVAHVGQENFSAIQVRLKIWSILSILTIFLRFLVEKINNFEN
jgi:hypothetical protein